MYNICAARGTPACQRGIRHAAQVQQWTSPSELLCDRVLLAWVGCVRLHTGQTENTHARNKRVAADSMVIANFASLCVLDDFRRNATTAAAAATQAATVAPAALQQRGSSKASAMSQHAQARARVPRLVQSVSHESQSHARNSGD